MVDVISLRLALSASEVKQLTGWPDAMVEDYIQILSDLVEIINDLNQALADIGTLFNDYANLNSDLAGVRSLAAQVRAKVNNIGRRVDSVLEWIPNAEQQLADASIAKIRARLAQSARDYKAWLACKGCLLTIEGAGASNPVLSNGYNVASVTRTAPGVYQATVQQDTFFTRPVLANSVFSHSNIIAPLTDSYNIEVVVTSATTFEIRVYELSPVLMSIQRSAYDLQAGDFVSVQALFSINEGLPPR